MSNLELNEGQEFFIGGKRYVAKNGAPVQEEKRGPLGGELVRYDSLEPGRVFFAQFKKTHFDHMPSGKTTDNDYHFSASDLVEINVPQQAKGRVMTAGEAARLPDIVGKRVLMTVDCVDPGFDYPLRLIGFSGWMHQDKKIEVLD